MGKRKAFTLVELSIVLIIIGLLVGGVLKGKAMIDNAKQKRVKTDIDGIVAATYSYQDKYGYLPAENPSSTVAGCTSTTGDGLIDSTEATCAWQDLIAAGYISGDVTSATPQKASPYGGIYDFDANTTTNVITVVNLPLDVANNLDVKYDDGDLTTGEILYATGGGGTDPQLIWAAF